jgi:cytochrome c-type biogenesis protein
MMAEPTTLILGALWLGVLTSISPCPLASNLAAISYVTQAGAKGARTRVVIGGLLYSFGRIIAYVSLAGVLTWSFLSVPDVANFLQVHMNRILGPVLLFTGAVVLGWIRIPSFGVSGGARLQSFADRGGLFGAGVLGFLFAYAFCPTSAALFFGGLLPLAIDQHSILLIPISYGFGTALPVVVVAGALAFGIRTAGKVFSATQVLERWVRRTTGAILLILGGYFLWTYIL